LLLWMMKRKRKRKTIQNIQIISTKRQVDIRDFPSDHELREFDQSITVCQKTGTSSAHDNEIQNLIGDYNTSQTELTLTQTWESTRHTQTFKSSLITNHVSSCIESNFSIFIVQTANALTIWKQSVNLPFSRLSLLARWCKSQPLHGACLCTETMPKLLIKNEVFRPLRRHQSARHLHRQNILDDSLLGLGLLSLGSRLLGGGSRGGVLLGSLALTSSGGLGLGRGPEGLLSC
jgi:hypothetical protein